jgi:hypothetical protein
MSDYDTIVRDRQKAIRREIDRRGISLKAIQYDGGWENPSTVLSYFPADGLKEPATMSMAAFYRLFQALPADLLSLLLPDGYVVVRAPEELNHDEIADAMREFLAAKDHAHHPDSPAGREISACEDQELRSKFTVVKAA